MLHVERIERQVLADRQVVALAKVMGGSAADLPGVAETVALFDDWLVSGFERHDDESARQREMLEWLGVA